MTRTHLVVILLAVSACSEQRTKPIERDVAVHPVLTQATQHDLAREVDQAERRGTWREVRQRWQGQRLTWTVTRQRLLCQSASACNVAAFPIQRPAEHGWMPTLEMTPPEYARMAAGCGIADQCEVQFEGTLSDLVLSPDQPTSVRFSDVRVVRAHST
jgi:hypothetical protein